MYKSKPGEQYIIIVHFARIKYLKLARLYFITIFIIENIMFRVLPYFYTLSDSRCFKFSA